MSMSIWKPLSLSLTWSFFRACGSAEEGEAGVAASVCCAAAREATLERCCAAWEEEEDAAAIMGSEEESGDGETAGQRRGRIGDDEEGLLASAEAALCAMRIRC